MCKRSDSKMEQIGRSKYYDHAVHPADYCTSKKNEQRSNRIVALYPLTTSSFEENSIFILYFDRHKKWNNLLKFILQHFS